MEEKNYHEILVNEYQSGITQELLDKYPKEVQKDFWDIVLTVPFIGYLMIARQCLLSRILFPPIGRELKTGLGMRKEGLLWI